MPRLLKGSERIRGFKPLAANFHSEREQTRDKGILLLHPGIGCVQSAPRVCLDFRFDRCRGRATGLRSISCLCCECASGRWRETGACAFYLHLSELMQGRLHVSDITRQAVKTERVSQRRNGERGGAGGARERCSAQRCKQFLRKRKKKKRN